MLATVGSIAFLKRWIFYCFSWIFIIILIYPPIYNFFKLKLRVYVNFPFSLRPFVFLVRYSFLTFPIGILVCKNSSISVLILWRYPFLLILNLFAFVSYAVITRSVDLCFDCGLCFSALSFKSSTNLDYCFLFNTINFLKDDRSVFLRMTSIKLNNTCLIL